MHTSQQLKNCATVPYHTVIKLLNHCIHFYKAAWKSQESQDKFGKFGPSTFSVVSHTSLVLYSLLWPWECKILCDLTLDLLYNVFLNMSMEKFCSDCDARHYGVLQ